MKNLLLGAALAIACWPDLGAGIPVQPDFDPQKLAGKWYALAIVKSKGPPDDILVLDHTVETVPNEDLLMRAQIPLKYMCNEKNISLMHTDRLGIYTARMQRVLSVVEAEYENYYILHVGTLENSFLQLFARKPEMPLLVENTYLSRVQSIGLDLKMVIYLDTIDRCP